MKHPHIIHRTGSKLKLSPAQIEKLREDPKTILWINDGLYALISIEVVLNELDVLDNYEKKLEMLGHDVTTQWIFFDWEQTVEIPVEDGKAMEQYNGSKLE